METGPNALYLFCLARSSLVGELPGTGVDSRHSLSVLRSSPDLCAVVSEVAREDFCGPGAEAHMAQLAWISPRALRHEAVVEEVMRHSPVLPTRFGTLFSSPERLGEFLDRHREAVSRFLDLVVDQEEWSVKGFLDRTKARQFLLSATLSARQEQLAALPPGRRYLEEQRAQAAREKGLSRWLSQTCQQVASALSKHISDFSECPVQPHKPGEGEVELVLNWAFLLPKPAIAEFRVRIGQLNAMFAGQGLSFELSGPWPPYRFVPPLLMDAPR